MSTEILKMLPDTLENYKFKKVYYDGKTWNLIGMCEDGNLHLVRDVEDSPFNIVEFEQVSCEDWKNIFLK